MEQFVKHFDSMAGFYDYLCKTPLNDTFRWGELSSVTGSNKFTGTSNFDEAVSLMKNGWTDMSTKLTQRLNAAAKPAPVMKQRNVLSVQGYQPVVPLYLAGVPTSMVSKQMVAIKSKVITVTKLINYNCGVKTETIIEESIKAMMVIKKLEAQGYRCNLNVCWGTEAGGRQQVITVRLKSANEKLNVSKLAFPLVHPSMLRRLFFRYLEVSPDTTHSFKFGYGCPMSYNSTKAALGNNHIVLPSIWSGNPENVKDLQTLTASV